MNRALLVAVASAFRGPPPARTVHHGRAAAPTARYEALPGGRPRSATLIGGDELAQLIERASREADHSPKRVWLELTNGQSLTVVFERTNDDTDGTCTMRVRQTRVTDECALEDPRGCVDVGCVAVRWNLNTRQGVLVDLFKAKRGDRSNCDLSSADDPKAKWGSLMLRVVDDVAALTRTRHVYLADESSTRLEVWNERTRGAEAVQTMLRCRSLAPSRGPLPSASASPSPSPSLAGTSRRSCTAFRTTKPTATTRWTSPSTTATTTRRHAARAASAPRGRALRVS